MGRRHIEDLRIETVVRQVPKDGPLAGAELRELSRDDASGDNSLIANLPAGFESGSLVGRAWDIYVLSGQVSVGDGTLSAGHYAFVPGNENSGTIRSASGAELFIGVIENQRREGDVLLVNPDDLPWDARVRAVPEAKNGLSHGYAKFFRIDQARSETVGLGALPPGVGLDCSEEHEPVDEILNLRGDLLILDNEGRKVRITPGIYQWRQPNALHLPKYSHTGNLNFFRTHGGLWGCPITFKRHDDWDEIVANYKAEWGQLPWPSI